MRLTIFLALLACLQPSVAAAQESIPFPSVPLSPKTIQVQNQAEKVYLRTDYKRAFFIYRNELAPIGDKYGQYMVGFMYLTGKGVPEDRVAASAWYRLAAERGIEEFVETSEQLMKSLDEEQTARSDQQFIELRKQYGDLALLLKAVKEDYDTLRSRTGSRLSSDSSSLTIVNPNSSGSVRSGADFYGRIEKRMKQRLEFIGAHANVEIVDINNVNLSKVEASVEEHLEKLD
jgi:hypothetical protein